MYLKDGDHGLCDSVEMTARFVSVGEVEGAAEPLHAQEGADENEQEEEQQQTRHGLDRLQKTIHQTSEARPVASRVRNAQKFAKCLALWKKTVFLYSK